MYSMCCPSRVLNSDKISHASSSLASLASAHRCRILSSSRREAGIHIFTETGRRLVSGRRRIGRMPDLEQSRYTGFYLRVWRVGNENRRGASFGLLCGGRLSEWRIYRVLRDRATAIRSRGYILSRCWISCGGQFAYQSRILLAS
jgi:hypothetical protein